MRLALGHLKLEANYMIGILKSHYHQDIQQQLLMDI